nr:lysophospholipid acyltransferase family protein [uncultured Flavobacterium sp.]
MGLFKRNKFGHILFLKRWLILIFGLSTHRRYKGFNRLNIEGSDILRSLPDTNVLFISNHQTYFADVVAMFHVFNASLKGRENNIQGVTDYLWNPKLNLYYVAAKETMQKGILPRLMGYVGAITVERTWRSNGKDVAENERKAVNTNDTENIGVALDEGWVITFPQGTTKSFKPVRKGTAHIIKNHRPIVVPIVIDGFRRSFDKKGLRLKKKGILQSMVIKAPLRIDYDNESIDEIVRKIEFAIEQHPSFLKVISVEQQEEMDKLNKKRTFKSFKK